MKVSIIIVTYNSAQFITACLDSVLAQTGVEYQLFIVDNASQDETVTILQSYLRDYPTKIELVLNKKNLGFACANNLVLNQITSEYIFSFNPDAVLAQQDALVKLVAFMQAHPQCGLVSTKVVEQQTGKESQPLAQYAKSKWCSLDFSHLPGKWAWVIGASLFIRAAPFKQLAGFCSEFFIYGDDLDICLRMRQLGYTVEYYRDVVATHIGGGCENRATEYQKRVRKQHGLYTFLTLHYPIQDVMTIAQHEQKHAKRKLFLKKAQRWLGLGRNDKREQYYRAVADATKIVLSDPSSPQKILILVNANPG